MEYCENNNELKVKRIVSNHKSNTNMIYKALVIVAHFHFAFASKCHINFTDEVLEKRTQAYLKDLNQSGMGDFPSGCPLLQPNTTAGITNSDFHCARCVFGMKLSRSACIPIDYPKDKAPNTYIELEDFSSMKDVVKLGGRISSMYERILSRDDIFFLPYSTIYVDVQQYRIRDINEIRQTVTMDISLSLSWMDNHIYSHDPYNIDPQLLIVHEGYEIYSGARTAIWKPDVPISNLSDYKSFHASMHVKSWKVLRSNVLDGNVCVRGPMLEYDIIFTSSFYCDFDLSNYPVDISICSLWIGGQSSNIVFKWSADAPKSFIPRTFSLFDVMANVTMIEATNDIPTNNKIGLKIEIKRVLRPFILKYYIPCFAIVFMAQLSFLIPLESLPARVGLVVTQFLTLISLFIQQMVNKLCDNLSKLAQSIEKNIKNQYRSSIFIYNFITF